MGSLLSSQRRKRERLEDHDDEIFQNVTSKRIRMSDGYDNIGTQLISTLPDEISYQILARVPRVWYKNLKSVSRTWKSVITGTEIHRVRRELGTMEEWLYVLEKNVNDRFIWHALDPKSGVWQKLPSMPNLANKEESRRGLSSFIMRNISGSDLLKGWFGRRCSSSQLPFCGCAVGAADGCLYVLGGFFKGLAMNCVWKYDPCSDAWYEVSSMNIGRAFCKTGVLQNKLYAVGGVTRDRGVLMPLHSAEVFDPSTGLWTQVATMPFSKAQVLPEALLSDFLKPIATGMTMYLGKLCVPQSLYSWPFFVDIGGEMYDPEAENWIEMPRGMGEGWPARQAGTKLSVVVNEELYTLDPSTSLEDSKVMRYNSQQDVWQVVVSRIPISDFSDSESPYLLSGLQGKLNVIAKGLHNGHHQNIVLQADMRKAASLSNSTPSSLQGENNPNAEADIWEIIACHNFGMSELVSCQVLLN